MTGQKKPRPQRWPEDSYGPEWKELWLRASREEFTIDFPDAKRLNFFILRARHYRNQQRSLNRPGWNLLYRASTTHDKNGPFPLRLKFYPVEEPNKQFFDQVGIKIDSEAPEIALPSEHEGEGRIVGTAESAAPMDDWMEKLVGKIEPEASPSAEPSAPEEKKDER